MLVLLENDMSIFSEESGMSQSKSLKSPSGNATTERFPSKHSRLLNTEIARMRRRGTCVQGFDVRFKLKPWPGDLYDLELQCKQETWLSKQPGTIITQPLLSFLKKHAKSSDPLIEKHRAALLKHTEALHATMCQHETLAHVHHQYMKKQDHRHYRVTFPFVNVRLFHDRPFDHYDRILDATIEWIACQKMMQGPRCCVISCGGLHAIRIRSLLMHHYKMEGFHVTPIPINHGMIDLEDMIHLEPCSVLVDHGVDD